MKGSHKLVVRGRRVQYTIVLERNITVLRGESATGKTTLVSLLQDYENEGRQSGVSVICDRPCHVIGGNSWEQQLESVQGGIVFVDEGNSFLTSADFARAVRESDNYYVLVTRENLYQLPYSVEAVLELRKTTSKMKITYNQAYPYYKYVPEVTGKLARADQILTEDSCAGNQLFSQVARDYGISCHSAGGKSGIYTWLHEHSESKSFVIADGAAFGAEMDKVYRFLQLHPDSIILYLPESFEWLIMEAGVVSDSEIREILAMPSDYIASERFFSWEQFFYDLLVKKTESTYNKYSKEQLADFYLQPKNVQRILRAIETKP